MFESKPRLAADILGLLDALRELAGGRYACVVDREGMRFESPLTPAEPELLLRNAVRERKEALLAVPAALAADEPLEDALSAFSEDEFLLAALNGRVLVLVACAEAEGLEARAEPLLHALSDRLLRYEERWRVDSRGRGLFFGRPRLDTVVIGREGG